MALVRFGFGGLLLVWSAVFSAPLAWALDDDERLPVAVTVPPLGFFVQAIGGDRVALQVLVGPGQNPVSFEPSAQALARLSEARLLVRTGVPFERAWVPRFLAVNGSLMVVDLSRPSIEMDEAVSGGDLVSEEGDEHGHGHGHEHGHDGDPHAWMSPRVALGFVPPLVEALSRLDPAGAGVYAANGRALSQRLRALDGWVSGQLAGLKRRDFLVFHPAFGVFARDYGLRQWSVEVDGKAPAARSLGRWVARVGELGVSVLFVQPQFDQRLARSLGRSLGLRLALLDPLSADYVANIRAMVVALKLADAADVEAGDV